MHDKETPFTDDAITVTLRGPYIPHDLVTALDTAAPATVDAFLTALETRTGEDIPAEEVWALWTQMQQTPATAPDAQNSPHDTTQAD